MMRDYLDGLLIYIAIMAGAAGLVEWLDLAGRLAG